MSFNAKCCKKSEINEKNKQKNTTELSLQHHFRCDFLYQAAAAADFFPSSSFFVGLAISPKKKIEKTKEMNVNICMLFSFAYTHEKFINDSGFKSHSLWDV